MRTRSKLLLAGLTASLLMSLAVSSASANRLSVSNTRIRATWSALVFTDESGEGRFTCPVTMEGSFHSATIRKIRGALMGYITRAIVNGAQPPCSGGTASILQTSLPWHLTYDSFTGTLPNITGIRLLLHNLAYQFFLAGFDCLYAADATHRAIYTANREAGGNINTLTADTAIRLLRQSGSIFCPASQGFSGVGQVFLLGNTSRIRITLI